LLRLRVKDTELRWSDISQGHGYRHARRSKFASSYIAEVVL